MTDAADGFVHATAVVVGEHGVLLEGPSGSGKSATALALVRQARAGGRFGRLVGDDRVGLSIAHGRLIARPHPAIAGLVERRGSGLSRLRHEPACVVHLVVRLADAAALPARLPDTRPVWRHGVAACPLLVLPAACGPEAAAGRIAEALAALDLSGSNDLANSAAMQKITPHGEAGGQGADRELDGSLR